MLIIPSSSELYTNLNALAENKRMIFVTGLPGVGKSLFIQQLAIMANRAGRKIHLMQWDLSRNAFETPEILTRYPEVDGVTAPMLRKAVGMWARGAILAWDEEHADSEHLLIGEMALIGNRFSELIEPRDDACEALLSAESTEFLVPVPSKDVRAVIEQAREKTIADPQHEKEKMDAPPNVLRALWADVNRLAEQIKVKGTSANSSYDPYIYGGVYDALLRHRHHQIVMIDQVLRPQGSVYDLDVATSLLEATSAEVMQTLEFLEGTMTQAEIAASVEMWHAFATDY